MNEAVGSGPRLLHRLPPSVACSNSPFCACLPAAPATCSILLCFTKPPLACPPWLAPTLACTRPCAPAAPLARAHSSCRARRRLLAGPAPPCRSRARSTRISRSPTCVRSCPPIPCTRAPTRPPAAWFRLVRVRAYQVMSTVDQHTSAVKQLLLSQIARPYGVSFRQTTLAAGWRLHVAEGLLTDPWLMAPDSYWCVPSQAPRPPCF